MRAIDCPRCGRILRLPAESPDQAVLCPGCGTRFLIQVDGGAWRPCLLGEGGEHSPAEAVRSAEPAPRPDRPNFEDDWEGEDEEPQLIRTVASGRTIFVDADRTRTRVVNSAFLVVFVPSLLLAGLALLVEGHFFGGLCIAPLIALTFGVVAAIVAGMFVQPSEKDQRSGEAVIEDRLEERRRQKRRRSAPSERVPPEEAGSPAPHAPEGPDESVMDPRDRRS